MNQQREKDLLDAADRYLMRARSAEAILQELVDLARVGDGSKPVMKSKRVNIPATVFHQAVAHLKFRFISSSVPRS